MRSGPTEAEDPIVPKKAASEAELGGSGPAGQAK